MPRQIICVACHAGYARNPPRVQHPAFFAVPDFLFQQLFKLSVAQPGAIRPQRHGMPPAIGADLPRRFRTVRIQQALRQPLWNGEHDGQIPRAFLRLGPCNVIFAADKAAQHTVDQPGQAFHPHRAGQLDRFVHHGAFRHPIHKQHLTDAQPQNVPHPLLQRVGIAEKTAQGKIDPDQIFKGGIHQTGAEPLLYLRQIGRLQMGVQHQRRVTVLLENILQGLKRHPAPRRRGVGCGPGRGMRTVSPFARWKYAAVAGLETVVLPVRAEGTFFPIALRLLTVPAKGALRAIRTESAVHTSPFFRAPALRRPKGTAVFFFFIQRPAIGLLAVRTVRAPLLFARSEPLTAMRLFFLPGAAVFPPLFRPMIHFHVRLVSLIPPDRPSAGDRAGNPPRAFFFRRTPAFRQSAPRRPPSQ